MKRKGLRGRVEIAMLLSLIVFLSVFVVTKLTPQQSFAMPETLGEALEAMCGISLEDVSAISTVENLSLLPDYDKQNHEAIYNTTILAQFSPDAARSLPEWHNLDYITMSYLETGNENRPAIEYFQSDDGRIYVRLYRTGNDPSTLCGLYQIGYAG